MCGICGFFSYSNSGSASRRLQEMTFSLKHRGPDGSGTWLDKTGTIGLASTRLAIIDVEGGHQPIHSSDGAHVLVFNGEIYGFRSLRRELIALGHAFRTLSDTEVILHAYRQWGRECVHHLRGMFAFAVYDENTRTLFLARDRTGIKPLYYYWGPLGFFFGSELKAILSNPEIPRRVNHRALADHFVFGYPLPP